MIRSFLLSWMLTPWFALAHENQIPPPTAIPLDSGLYATFDETMCHTNVIVREADLIVQAVSTWDRACRDAGDTMHYRMEPSGIVSFYWDETTREVIEIADKRTFLRKLQYAEGHGWHDAKSLSYKFQL